jgi:mono/diheme cytochrome c family protein
MTCQQFRARAQRPRDVFLCGLYVFVLMALAGCSLAEDITPPPGATPLRPASPIATADEMAVLATLRPSAELGAPLFAQHCAACHGPLGDGDGEQAARLPNPPARLSSPDLARARSPREWFDILTNGRLERFMPPFGQTLTAEERWHLVAFVFSLSTPPAQMEAGAAVYAARCAECHGEDGRAANDLTAPAGLVERTPAEWARAIETNAAHTGLSLSSDEVSAVTDFTRGLAFVYLAPGAPPPERTGRVTGRVSNGTAGAALPSALELTLFAVEADGVAFTRTVTLQTDGAFEFAEVPFTAARQFVVNATYNGVPYYGELRPFAPGQSQLESPLTIFEATSDPAALRVHRAQTFILFDQPGVATIGQLFTLGNRGDRTFIPNQRTAVQFALPPEAADFAVPGGEEGVTYIRLDEGFADLRPVPPGVATLEVLVSYRLPEASGLSFAQPMRYPIDSATVLVNDATAQVGGEGWARSGTQDVQGQRFITYQRDDIGAGEALTFALVRGEAANATGIAIGAAALAALGAALFVWWRRRPRPGADGREALLAQLAALDDDFAAGKLNNERYEGRRAELKGRLMELWAAKESNT